MADELQNTSQFFRRFKIRPDPLDAHTPRPGPYLFHSVGMQNQFRRTTGNQQFFHTKFLCHMRHPRQAQSRAAKAKAQRTRKSKARSYEQEPWL